MEFTEKSVKEYLDKRIVYWKKKRDIERGRKNRSKMFPSIESIGELRAIRYIEIYESVRIDIFGCLKG